MTTLTNEMRNRIVSKLIQHRFSKEQERVKKLGHAVALAVYNDTYSKKERDLMASLPEGWLPECGSMRGVFGGEHGRALLSANARMPYRDDERYVKKSYDGDHKITQQYVEWKHAEKSLEAAIDGARTTAFGLLQTAKTVEKLLSIWPEVKPFIPEQTPRPAPVAIPVGDLNALLKLPVRTRIAAKAA